MSEAALLERLRDLSLVDVDALLTGFEGSERDRLLAAHVADLEDALAKARGVMERMQKHLGSGPQPLAWVDWTADQRAGEAGHSAAEHSSRALSEQAEVCRDFAVLADAAARVVPRLAVADRRSS